MVNRHSAKYAPQATGPTVADVCLAFLDHAEDYYTTSSEYENFRLAVVPLSQLYAKLPARDFGVAEFRTVRQWLLDIPIDRSHTRKPAKTAEKQPAKKKQPASKPEYRTRGYINKQMRRLIRIFRWAVGEGMIPPIVPDTLKCVDPLKRGRTKAPEASTGPRETEMCYLNHWRIPILQYWTCWMQLSGWTNKLNWFNGREHTYPKRRVGHNRR